MEPTSEHVSELRSKFVQKLEIEHGSTKTNYFHQYDMDRIFKSDDWLRRFLLHHENDVKCALNMVWETCLWRNDNEVNDINENNVNVDYLEEGSMFVHNRDKDGKLLFIFKCKKHLKGQKDLEQLKRCVVYWFERVDKMEKNAMISIFFDMQDTGLNNMDMEYTKYLIGLCKLYYPNFLNYILIFEMPWFLNAAFKVIKAWLPPKGVQKIKFVNKSNLKEFIDHDQALTSWGGSDDYIFRFTPKFTIFASEIGNGKSDDNKKKVHFADGSPIGEGVPAGFETVKEDSFQNSVLLSITPSESVVFSEGHHSELNGVVKLTNVSGNPVTYKVYFVDPGFNRASSFRAGRSEESTRPIFFSLGHQIKTTSPEKFRVRPSLGLLEPTFSASINVSVQPGFTGHSILRDKFLVMSFPSESHSLSQSELSALWKATDFKKISQHRLKCFVVYPHSHVQNGAAFNLPLRSHSYEADGDQKISQLISAVNHMTQCNEKIITQMSYINVLEKIIITLLVLLAMAVYMVYTNLPRVHAVYSRLHHCSSTEDHEYSYAEGDKSPSFHEECYKPD